jgi:GTP-binding protein
MVADERDESQGNMGKFAHAVQHAFRNMSYMPLAFITAKTGRNVKALLNLSQSLFKQANRRVGTGSLNRILREAVAAHPPATRENRSPRIYYATQVGSAPPTIVLFVNSTRLFDPTYQRYLLNVFREKLPFRDVPIKLYMRARTQTAPEARGAARAERRLGEGIEAGDDWDESYDDFDADLATPDMGGRREVEDVRFINREVNDLLSDLET